MKLNSLTPINGSKTNRKRRGRGHGSGLGKSAEEVIRALGKDRDLNVGLGLKVVRCFCPEDYQREDLRTF